MVLFLEVSVDPKGEEGAPEDCKVWRPDATGWLRRCKPSERKQTQLIELFASRLRYNYATKLAVDITLRGHFVPDEQPRQRLGVR